MKFRNILIIFFPICFSFSKALDIDNFNLDIDNLLNTFADDPVKADSFGNKNSDSIDFSSLFEQFLDSKPGEPCEFKCPNNKKPTVNPLHTPTFNGCGPLGMKLEITPEISKCCETHDICYDTCNSDKLQCDKDFKSCIQNTCVAHTTKEDKETCGQMATVFHSSTDLFGCGFFKKSQAQACTCPIDDSRSESVNPASFDQHEPEHQEDLEDFDSPLGDAPDFPTETDDDFEKMMRMLREEL